MRKVLGLVASAGLVSLSPTTAGGVDLPSVYAGKAGEVNFLQVNCTQGNLPTRAECDVVSALISAPKAKSAAEVAEEMKQLRQYAQTPKGKAELKKEFAQFTPRECATQQAKVLKRANPDFSGAKAAAERFGKACRVIAAAGSYDKKVEALVTMMGAGQSVKADTCRLAIGSTRATFTRKSANEWVSVSGDMLGCGSRLTRRLKRDGTSWNYVEDRYVPPSGQARCGKSHHREWTREGATAEDMHKCSYIKLL